ncbi:thioredoxin family protein [Hymenobacter lapidiphilus]|uniref:Thioredoxin family protein n=1 Tax=Hymenobacter lapidiphilus TaxID=2608003 RepID=A0A7Y7U6U3_9BACT|nr:thioredoxin family protein [Hymenobacter lapidiphilus]NVO31800.1 thioredoxin family protein [Hymenobacter lapidiphilus]
MRVLLFATALLAAELGLASAGFAQTTSAAAVPAAPWVSSLEVAMQQAKATNRPVLAVFSGSDWCKPCIMLKQEVFDTPAFEQFARDRFVLAHFDFPRSKKNKLSAEQQKQNELAASKLNQEGSFPLVILLSPEGKVLAKTGYRPGGEAAYEAHLTALLARK